MSSMKAIMKMEESVEDALELLFERAYDKIAELHCTAYVTKEPLPFARKTEGTEMDLPLNGKWAEDVFDCAWFHITGDLPAACPVDRLVFLIDCGGEGLVYDRDGIEKQAITCHASDFSAELGMPYKKVVFDDNLSFGGNVDFWIDCGANDLFGKMKNESRMKELCVARANWEIRALAYDMQVLYGAYEHTKDPDFPDEILPVLVEVAEQCEDITEEIAKQCRQKLAALLSQKNDGPVFQYTAIGHAHLDLAWLWPIRESWRKVGRTVATQILNIGRYPGYSFGASQAQLYQWMQDFYPRLYGKVKELAKGDSWELQGATWVEMDSNLIGGESLIRQFFYGKQYYLQEFGQEMNIFWVPDSFGYSACVPQVMRLAGVPYFLTQKMSWNTVNKFPYHSFRWQGLDGSEVLSYMLPEDTYNSPMRPDFLAGGESNYQERAISDKSMLLYGIGDGGAGPGFEHIERANRLADLRGMPKVKLGKAADFFREFDDGVTPYPPFQGELYLERHQGTYTTQAKNKKFNRKCEFALRNYELLTALATDKGIAAPIGKEALDTIWKEILLYQFHDILPGSSINRVYEESVARYESIYAELTAAIQTLLDALVCGKCLVNLNAFAYEKAVKLDGAWYKLELPALGCAAASEETKLTQFHAKAEDNSIENDKVKLVFEDGCIVSLYDKILAREFVAEGQKMGLISQYTDVGDCWDIRPVDYEGTKQDAVCNAFSVGTDGAEAFALAEHQIGGSKITQRFSIVDGSALVSSAMRLDIRQESAMLRIAFPSNVETEECNFNIQFGHLSRRTTNNNSFETAQYEVSGQKFVDMSEESCGLSLLNDCKYGYKCKGGVMDMDLFRAPKDGPGHQVDQGAHTLQYALLPHAGSLGIETYQEAYLLNNPLLEAGGGGVADCRCCSNLYSTTNPAVILESVKIPEDGNGILARFYNAGAVAAEAEVTLKGYAMAEDVDILENSLRPRTDRRLALRGFELVIVRFVKLDAR